MSSNVTVRRAEQADLENLRSNEPRPEQKLADKRFEEMTAGTGILAVAEVDGQLAGSGYLDFVDAELQPEVKNLWVYPAFRRQGAGQALWTWLEEQAREAGHTEVFLAVDPNNSKALPLFVNLGYSATGDHLMVDDPDTHQVVDPEQVSNHYAIYRKSLTMN
ncbi:GNAT family N-acetyltransferase [Luteococcus peritonei]|uniref:GNAT family N-acetyltransferase n=1 Tax=Luteococcus peritonei TaxID=88874 RepID=A0ABW4RYQ8_9ACTN